MMATNWRNGQAHRLAPPHVGHAARRRRPSHRGTRDPPPVAPAHKAFEDPGRAGVPTMALFTKRQTEILGLIAEGQSDKEIARELGVGVSVVQRIVADPVQRSLPSTRAQPRSVARTA